MHTVRRHSLTALAILATTASACGGAAPPPDATKASAKAPGCSATSATSALTPLARDAVGSTVALGRLGAAANAKTVAVVADEDAKALYVVDLDGKKELSKRPLDGTPAQVLILADGRVVVSLRDQAKVAVFEAHEDGQLASRCAVAAPTEPIGLAATPDQSKLLVTSGWGHAMTSYKASDLSRLDVVELPREPRAVVVSDDGKTAFVSHSVGSAISVVSIAERADARALSLIVDPNDTRGESSGLLETVGSLLLDDREDKKVAGRFGTRAGCQGFALAKSVEPEGRILAPQVLVDPGDPEGRTTGYGEGGTPTEVANVVVIDEVDKGIVPASVRLSQDQLFRHAHDPTTPPARECLLPRAATVDAESRSLLVTCYGIGALVAYDAASANPAAVEKRRWSVGAGPSGVAVDAAKRRAVVWAQFDRTLHLVPLAEVAPVDEDDGEAFRTTRIALSEEGSLPYDLRLGRQLFHAVGDTRISSDGRACASCHPDGRDDAITWATPDGPRRTAMLAGRLEGTAPYSWNGENPDLEHHVKDTFERLSGQGLHGMELEALLAYVSSVAPPSITPTSGDALAMRGREIFHSEEAACSSCHTEDAGYSDGHKHDVGSRAVADKGKKFNTPSLRFLSGRAPYFHDGRYQTLGELLRESDGRMGHTAHLSNEDLKALESFLLTL